MSVGYDMPRLSSQQDERSQLTARLDGEVEMESLLFNPLPAPLPRSRCFLAGWSLQFFLVGTLLVLNAVLPKARPPVHHYVLTSLVRYQPEVPLTPQPINPRPQINNAVTMPTKAWTVAKAAPPLVRKQQPDIKVPELKMESKLPQLSTAIPRKVVALNTFSTGSSAAPTTTKSAVKVQTGGFGDPEGASPRPSRTSAALNLATAGAFDLPNGSGRGNGAEGDTPGVVVSAGFGNGIAVGTRRTEGPVRNAGFDAAYASSAPHQVGASAEIESTPVAILYKPTPAYTEDGRKQGIDGEVRLEVLFRASGQVHVIRVLQGLGHGLDEQAVRAAEQIKFKPALHAGQAVDSTAVVHIIFQLAS